MELKATYSWQANPVVGVSQKEALKRARKVTSLLELDLSLDPLEQRLVGRD